MSKAPKFTDDDLHYALDCACDFLYAEEWPGQTQKEKEAQGAANREAARLINQWTLRYFRERAAREIKKKIRTYIPK